MICWTEYYSIRALQYRIICSQKRIALFILNSKQIKLRLKLAKKLVEISVNHQGFVENKICLILRPNFSRRTISIFLQAEILLHKSHSKRQRELGDFGGETQNKANKGYDYRWHRPELIRLSAVIKKT